MSLWNPVSYPSISLYIKVTKIKQKGIVTNPFLHSNYSLYFLHLHEYTLMSGVSTHIHTSRWFAPEFFTHMQTSLPVKAIDLYSVFMAVELQWEFFSVPHLLWHGASIYDGHLLGPVTLTPVAERFAVELSLPVLRLRSVEAGSWTPNLSHERRTIKILGQHGGPFNFKNILSVCLIRHQKSFG